MTQHRNTSEQCFHHLFEAQAERTPEAPAVVYGDRSLTYRELNQRANRLANHLRGLGAAPDTLVGICLERSPEMMVALLAILKAGAAYLPLDASYPRERVDTMLEDSKAPIILTQERFLGRFSSAAAKVIPVDQDWPAIARQTDQNPVTGVTPDNLAYVIYTSGSTGKPKGVMIHHRGLVNYLSWASRFYAMSEGEGSLVHSPLGFDLTITTLFAPLLTGQRVVLLSEGLGVEELAGALRGRRDFSVVKVTPTHLEALTHLLPPECLSGSARAVVIGGEMLRREHIAAWRKYAPDTRLINEYGPTETVVGCCVYEVTDDAVTSGSVPIGRAIDHMEMYVLGPELQPVPAGEIGEVYIGGAGLARGYLNQPAVTEEKFVPHPFNREPDARLYRTGDLARYLPDGNLEYLGRTDQQVKVRGFRIELGEIEVALAQHPKVRDCAVVARQDGSRGQRLVAYVVGRSTIPPTINELRDFLQERLPGYMVPSAFVSLEELPLTVNGKIDRDALPSPDQRRLRPDRSFKTARDPLEIQLTEIWEEILKVRPIGVSEGFLELGGDSLQAVLMSAKIEEIRGRHIPPWMVMAENTIEKLARAIHQLDFEPKDSTIVEVQPKGHLPPMFLVPGIGGMVLGLSYLAQRLGKDRPLYGLQARGVRDSERPCTSIGEMADYYIDAIKAVQPQGPYFIGGYSFGGMAAFEMARQLHAGGQQVGMLAIFDSVAPGSHGLTLVNFIRNLPYWTTDFVLQRDAREVLSDCYRTIKKMSKKAGNWMLSPFGIESLKADVQDDVEIPPSLPEKYRRVIEAHYDALLSYRPGMYSGRLTLFRTKAQPLFRAFGSDNGWSRLVGGGVEIYNVNGNHLNFMQEPYVRSLAQQLLVALTLSM